MDRHWIRALSAHRPGPRQLNPTPELASASADGPPRRLRHLHAAGANVVVADLNEQRGSELAGELGERAHFQRTDVTDAESVQAAVDAAAALAGGIRISVCCAGIGWTERVASKRGANRLEPFETVMRVNLIGTFDVLRLSAMAMVANQPADSGERGVCINTASIATYRDARA